MPIIKRLNKYQGLRDIDVFIDEKGTSEYFNVTSMPEEIPQGKSTFLIGGSPFLKNNIEIKIEMIDSAGKTIYMEPVANYLEGGGRRVSIEVYPDTAPGIAKLYILGELKSNYTDFIQPPIANEEITDPPFSASDPPSQAFLNQFEPDIPEEFQGVYNVRAEIPVLINTTITNTQPILFYKQPRLTVSEIVKGFVSETIPSASYVVSGNLSITPIPEAPPESPPPTPEEGQPTGITQSDRDDVGKNLSIFKNRRSKKRDPYRSTLFGKRGRKMRRSSPEVDKSTGIIKNVSATPESAVNTIHSGYVGSSFKIENIEIDSAPLQGQAFTITGSYTTKIKKTLNNTTFIPLDDFTVTLNNGEKVPVNITNATFTASIDPTPGFVVSTTEFRSFADITIGNLRTFSGDVYKAQVYAKSQGTLGDFEPVYDAFIESSEVLIDKLSPTGFTTTGFFYTQSVVDAYWQTTNGTQVESDAVIIDGVEISGSNLTKSQSVDFKTRHLYDLEPNVAYNVEFNTYFYKEPKTQDDGTIKKQAIMNVYVTGSKSGDKELLGRVDVGEGEEGKIDSIFKTFISSAIPVPKMALEFHVEAGRFILQDLSVRPMSETNFNPDYHRVIVPMPHPLPVKPDKYSFVTEFYDVNNNVAETFAVTENVDFDGAPIVIAGDGNILSGSMLLGTGMELYGGSAFLRTVGYKGFEKTLASGSGGFMVFSGSIGGPGAPENLISSSEDYDGVGLEIIDAHTTNNPRYLKFRTNPSTFEVITDTFYFGKQRNQPNSQFVSGSSGNIEISSSAFHLDTKNNIMKISGSITASTAMIGRSDGPHVSFDGTNINMSSSVFMLGDKGTSFVSGSSGQLEMSSSAFHLDTKNNVMEMSGSITASKALIGKPAGPKVSFDGTNIVIDTPNFDVTSGGSVSMAGTITATAGTIGGFNIGSDLDSSGGTLKLKGTTGQITASAAQISGKVTATSGQIAGWKIVGNVLSGSNATLDAAGAALFKSDQGPDTDGTAAFDILRDEYYIDFTPADQGNTKNYYVKFGPNFAVDDSGTLHASGAVFQGTITASAGLIGGFTTDDHAFSGTNFFISGSATGNQRFISTTNFNVKASGDITGSDVLFSGGRIANWDIIGDTLSSVNASNKGIILDADNSTPIISVQEDSNNKIELYHTTTTNWGIKGISGGNTIFRLGNTNQISGWTIGTDRLSGGTGTSFIGLIPGTGIQMGHETFNSAPFSVTNAGVLKATSGTIGGFTLGTNTLTATNFTLDPSGKRITLGSGNSIFVADGDEGIQLGHATFGSAPFRVTTAGVLTATSGTIGGFTIGTTQLSGGTGATTVALTPGAGIHAGATLLNAAPFSVTNAGVLKAESGTIAGWTLGTEALTGGEMSIQKSGTIESVNFASDVPGSGFRLTAEDGGFLEVENARIRGTLKTAVFEKETVNAVGGQLYVANSTALTGSTAAPGGIHTATQTTMSVENASGFVAGEILTIKKIHNTGFNTEYLRVISSSRFDASSDTNQSGLLFVQRGYGQGTTGDSGSLGGQPGSATFYSGSQVVVSTGRVGTGYIRLNANPADQATPYIDIVERTGSAIYDIDLKARLGDLSGLSAARLHGTNPSGQFGLYSKNVFLEGGIVANTGSIAGIKMQNSKLFVGTGTHGNANTGFYVDNAGNFSLKDKLIWNGSSLTLKGALRQTLSGDTITDFVDRGAWASGNNYAVSDLVQYNGSTWKCTGSHTSTNNTSTSTGRPDTAGSSVWAVYAAGGSDGADGNDGQDGQDGQNGQDGATGPQGATGAAGADGNDGANAQNISLNSTAQSFRIDQDGTVTPASITFTANRQNIASAATFTTSPSVTLGGSGDTRTLSSGNFGSNNSVTVTAGAGGISDSITVVRLAEGTDGLTIVNTNQAHVFPANSAGVVSSYTDSGTTIKVFEGATQLDFDGSGGTSGHFNVTATQSPSSTITIGGISESGDNAVVANHSSMQNGTDAVTITYTISGKKLNGDVFSITSVQTLTKSKAGVDGVDGAAGADGSAGANARSVSLTTTQQAFTYNAAGASPSPASATITATALNTSGTVYYQFFKDDVSQGAASTTNTLSYTPQSSHANMPDKIEVQIREGSASGTIVARDQITIIGVKPGTNGTDGTDGTDGSDGADGEDAVTIALSNEAHTLPTSTAGVVNFTGSGTDIICFLGATQLNVGTGNSQFSVSASGTNVTVGGASTVSSNIRRFANHSNMTQDTATVTYTITVKNASGATSTFTKIQSLGKSKQGSTGAQGVAGADGSDGAAGANARAVNLTAGDQAFAYNASGTTPSPTSTTITATASNTTGTVNFQFFLNDSSQQNGTSNTYTYTPQANFSNMPDKVEVQIREGSTSGTVLARDQITLSGVKPGADGEDGFTVLLSNESHTVPQASAQSGGAFTFTGSGTNITVFKGTTQQAGITSGSPSAGQFLVSRVGSGVTAGSLSAGTPATIGNITGMSAAIGTITYTITPHGASAITKIQSFSKSQAADSGSDGTNGNDGATGAAGPTGSAGAGVVHRGEWEAGEVYTSNATRKDVVKYTPNTSSPYWIAKTTHTSANTTSGTGQRPPASSDSSNDNWETFGAVFSSVATDILLAQDATITRGLLIGTDGVTDGFIRSTNALANSGTGFFLHEDGTIWFGNRGASYLGISSTGVVTAAGFTFNTSNLTSNISKSTFDNTSSGVYVGTDGIGLGTGQFKVSAAGAITSTSGTIGNWTIGASSLSGGTGTSFIGLIPGTGIQMGHQTFNSAPFSVTNAGVLKATSGTVGGWTLSSSTLIGGQITLTNTGQISVGSAINISGTANSNTGQITIGSHVTLNGNNSSTISGWTIGSTLSAGGGATFISLDPGNSKIRIGAKAGISDGNAGVHLGSDGIGLGANSPFKVTNAGVLTATSGTIGGVTLGATKLHLGTGTYANSNTAFYVDTSGNFSLKDKLTFTGSTLTVAGTINASGGNFTGDVSAGGVTIGTGGITGTGYTINTAGIVMSGGSINLGNLDSLTDVGDTDTGFFVDSSGNVLIKQGGANSNYLQFRSGALVIETTNFSIDSNGDVSVTGTITASGGSFTGNVTAGGVTIGTGGITGTGYTINTGGIVMSGGSINLGNLDAITDTADTDTGFMVDSSGNVLIKQGGANANFLQFTGGNLVIKTTNFEIASNGNVTVTGAITATSGTFTGAINASGGTFTGHVTAGGAKFGVDVESTNDGIYLTADNHWYDSGVLTCNNITATGGAIGGFTLASSTLSSTNLLLDSTNQKLVFRDASNDYLTFVTETNSFSKTGDSGDAANVTTAYIKQLTGTDLVILHGDADRITFVGPGRFRAAYTHTSPTATLDDGVQEGSIEGRTANYRGNLSSTIGADNINAGVLGVNNRGGTGGLKVGIYGRCNDHWTSVGILGEGKYRADLKSSSWSGVFRHRPFVVGDPFEASNGIGGYNDGDLDEWSDRPNDEYAALMVFPYNARSDDNTTDARRGRVGIRKWLPDYELDVTGTIRATGNVIAYSDERKKENVVRIENGLSLVEQLRGVRFDWKEGFQQETNTDKGKRQIGVIAQEVEKVLPEVVSEDAQGFKSVNYPTLTAVLIESVKDLKQIIDNQQKQIDELKKVIGVNNGNK